jgi:cytidine deaminase
MKEKLIKYAQEVCTNAYAPYSGYRVGASLLTHGGGIYHGCNVENLSYGLSICAERNAVFQAIASEGPGVRLKAIAVANGRGDDCTPCGACRQVLMEFNQETVVFCRREGEWKKFFLEELLPASFSFDPSISGTSV